MLGRGKSFFLSKISTEIVWISFQKLVQNVVECSGQLKCVLFPRGRCFSVPFFASEKFASYGFFFFFRTFPSSSSSSKSTRPTASDVSCASCLLLFLMMVWWLVLPSFPAWLPACRWAAGWFLPSDRRLSCLRVGRWWWAKGMQRLTLAKKGNGMRKGEQNGEIEASRSFFFSFCRFIYVYCLLC